MLRTIVICSMALSFGIQSFGQINEFKKLLPVEDAPGFNYGFRMAFSNGLGVIASPGGPCDSGTGSMGSTCGRAYVMRRDNGGRWSLVDFFYDPVPSNYETYNSYGTYVATSSNSTASGGSVAIGRIEQTQGFNSPSIDIYQVNGSGQIFFGKTVNYTFGADYFASSTYVKWPIAMAPGIMIAGNPYDINRNPMNGDLVSTGRVLIYGENTGGTYNWGLSKVIEAPAPFGSSFGSTVSCSSDLIFSGAPDINAVYVYSKDFGGTDNWGLIKSIIPGDAAAEDSFGFSISVSSNIVVIGSPKDDDNGTDSGAIYIFDKDQGGADQWGLVKKIVPADGSANDQFGYSVAIENNDLAVGIPDDDDNGNNSGSVYHFSKDEGGINNWGLVSKIIKNPGTYTDEKLGQSVAIDGNQLLVGAPFNDLQGTNSGAVSLYQKNGNEFDYVTEWSASKASRYAQFGYNVSLDPTLAMINNNFIISKDSPAPDAWGLIAGENISAATAACYNQLQVELNGEYAFRSDVTFACTPGVDEGTVTVMKKDQGGSNNWGDFKVVTPTATNYGGFGWKMSSFQDVLAVNAYRNVNGGTGLETGSTKGEIYIFSKDLGGNDNWGQLKKITAANAQDDDYFGYDLSVKNEILAASAPGFTNNTGAVFIYSRNNGGTNNWGLIKRIDTPDGGTSDRFGEAIQLNDNNLVVAAPGNNANEGAVYLFNKDQGGTDSWGLVKKILPPTINPGGKFGTRASISGEALVVSDKDGKLYLFNVNDGGINNWGYTGQLLSSDYSSTDGFGSSFSVSGNVVLVGAPNQSNSLGTNVGAAYLFYTPPPAPIVNSATGLTNSTFSISWSAVSNASGYKVDVSTNSDFSTFLSGFNGLSTTQTNVSLSSLIPNQHYYVRVRSVRTLGGESNSSNVIIALTAPANPTAIDATLINGTGFTANWNSVPGATGYLLDVSTDNFSNFVLGYNGLAVNGTSYSVTGLTSSTAYQFRVRASSGSGVSGSSNAVDVTTLALSSSILSVGSIVYNSNQDIATTQTLTIPVTGGTVPYTVIFKHKGILANDYTTEPALVATAPGSYSTTITPAMLDAMGVDFEIKVTDAINDTNSKTGRINIGFDETNSPALPFERFGGSDESWNLFSIPYDLDNKSISSILADYDQARHEFDWRIMRYRTTTNDYVNFNIGQVKLGEAYWFNAKENIVSKVGAGQTTSQVPFSLTLAQGWNMVGNPYPISISWNKVLADNAGVAGVGALQVFSGITQSAGDVLVPFKGGFVFADAAATVLIDPITAKSGGRVSSTSTKGQIVSRDVDDVAWILPFSLWSSGAEEELGGIGMHPEAKELKDAYDAMAVPRFIKHTDLSTKHQDYFYPWFSRDVVPTQTSHSWNFTLSSNRSKGLTQLTWDQQALQGKQAKLYFLDKITGSVIDMKSRGSYPVDLNRGDFKFEVYYSSNGEPYLPQELILGDAYPNPASTSATIPVVLPADAGAIELTVYDMTGRPVATLAKGNFAPGAYEFKWDIKERKSINGMFIYRLLFTEKAHAPIQKKLIIK
ncbi:MAG: hypothetical protein KDC93_17550 [Cyclobacteriaceae bacterium]|nr:hypothetical protein [Cyclobacteriaceae bacterium]